MGSAFATPLTPITSPQSTRDATRKLMQAGQRPVGVGFFFSLGHSTVVIVMCAVVALGTGVTKTRFPQFQEVGGIVGTSVSALFLLLIAAINFVIFVEVFRVYRAARTGRQVSEDALTNYWTVAACWPDCFGRCSGSSPKVGTCTRSASCSVWALTRLRKSRPRHRGDPGRPAGVTLVHQRGFPALVHRGHVPDRHDGWRGHARGLRMGFRPADAGNCSTI